MNVRDKVIMITGAGGGLGSEMARLLCANGAQVFILFCSFISGRAKSSLNMRAVPLWHMPGMLSCWTAGAPTTIVP